MFFCFNSGVKAYLECEFGDPDFGDVYFSFYVDQNGTPHYNNTYDDSVYYFEGSGYSYNSCPETVYINGDENITHIYLDKNVCSNNFGYCYNYPIMSSKEIDENIPSDEYEEGEKLPSEPGSGGSSIGPGGCSGTDCTPPGKKPTIFEGGCPSDLGIIDLLGSLYSLLKIAAPIALVIFGMLDFGKAVISSDEGKMKKAQSTFIRRIMGAVVVFLVMSLLTLVSNLIPSESGVFSCVKDIFK